MKTSFKNAIIFWLVLTLSLTFFLYIGAKDGGSDEHPVYRSLAQQENPFLIFWEFLPICAGLSAIITVIGTVIINAFKNKKNFREAK